MQGYRMLTKKELHELIDREFSESNENDFIASFFICLGEGERVEQQCLMFHKEINGWED